MYVKSHMHMHFDVILDILILIYAHLLSQILIVLTKVFFLCVALHVKLEPLVQSFIVGSNSTIRLNVITPPSMLSSFFSTVTAFDFWLSCCHSTLSSFGKKSLKVQISLTDSL